MPKKENPSKKAKFNDLRSEKKAEEKTEGFPKDTDFKKFLGCGG